MGRKVNQDLEETQATTTSEAEPSAPMLEGGALGVTDAKNTVGGAEVETQTKVFEPVQRNSFRVGGYQPMRINTATGITHLHPGQIVDDQNYDIEKLKGLGIPLTAVIEPAK